MILAFFQCLHGTEIDFIARGFALIILPCDAHGDMHEQQEFGTAGVHNAEQLLQHHIVGLFPVPGAFVQFFIPGRARQQIGLKTKSSMLRRGRLSTE